MYAYVDSAKPWAINATDNTTLATRGLLANRFHRQIYHYNQQQEHRQCFDSLFPPSPSLARFFPYHRSPAEHLTLWHIRRRFLLLLLLGTLASSCFASFSRRSPLPIPICSPTSLTLISLLWLVFCSLLGKLL